MACPEPEKCDTLHALYALNTLTNSMMTVEIYRYANTWCFTDEARGLLHEPFVLGIPEMIDYLIQLLDVKKKEAKYSITFSENNFPTCKSKLEKIEEEYGGAWYSLHTEGVNVDKGWLCPATLKFFPYFPKTIYLTLA